ncbi:MAG: hypothetical protein WA892_02215 [Ornithinimicrobium sp.]
MSTDAHVTLLGPQRTPRLGQVVAALGLSEARFGTINAGWQEREPDDELLSETLNHNTVNLRLWHRMQQVWESDPELAQADLERRRLIEEMQELYLLGLDHAIRALIELLQHSPREERVRQSAITDAETIIRDLDRRHLQRIEDAYAEFWQRWRPHERDSIARARQAVARELADTQAVVLTGGHVGVLLGALHLFNIAPALDVPIIAWGAGAMVLTERVVLFHDRAAHGPAIAEVYGTGLGLVRGTVALPSPRERLDLGDRDRMAVLARRFAPSQGLLLGTGTSVHVGYDGALPPGATVLLPDGSTGASGLAS